MPLIRRPVRIRRAGSGDLPRLDDFHRWRCTPQSLQRRWGRSTVRRHDLTRLMSLCDCWIALDSETGDVEALAALGPVSAEPGVVDLGLQVADIRHRQGLGTVMTRLAAAVARNTGAHTLTARTEMSNTPALRLLRRLPVRESRDGTQVEVRIALHYLNDPDGTAPRHRPHRRAPPLTRKRPA